MCSRQRLTMPRLQKIELSEAEPLPQIEVVLCEREKSLEIQHSAVPLVSDHQDQLTPHDQRDVINEVLPSEILLHIFRDAITLRADFMAPIRLTHVCRYWRTLIHNSPSFWLVILDPATKHTYTFHRRRFPIVLAALERSQPIPQLALSMNGAFLPVLSALPEHISRISTLWLDYSYNTRIDILPLLNIELPNLEKLTLWRFCDNTSRVLSSIATPVFPRLHYLRTNCVQFALKWVTPAIRSLIFGGRHREFEDSALVPRECCRFWAFSHISEALERCPDLEEFEIVHCLPGDDTRPDPTPLRHFHRLKKVHLEGNVGLVRAMLEYLAPRAPDTTSFTVSSGDVLCNSLSDLLPRSRTLASMAHVRSLAFHINRRGLHSYVGSVDAEADDGDPRISMYSGNLDPYACDLLRFFKGATPYFPPLNITRISVRASMDSQDHSEGSSWLFAHYPKVTELVLDVYPDSTSLLASLVPADVLVHLERLTVITSPHGTSALKVNEAAVSALEDRAAAHGSVRLRSLSFKLEVERKDDGVYPSLTYDQIARLEAVTDELVVDNVILN